MKKYLNERTANKEKETGQPATTRRKSTKRMRGIMYLGSKEKGWSRGRPGNASNPPGAR